MVRPAGRLGRRPTSPPRRSRARGWVAAASSADARRTGSALLRPVGNWGATGCANRRDRIAWRPPARARLGLPLDLADDDFADVDWPPSPRPSLRAALEELPPHERRALELRVVEEMPYDDVARSLRIRPAAARLRVSRALRRLASVKEHL